MASFQFTKVLLTVTLTPILLILCCVYSAMPEIETALTQLKSAFRHEDGSIDLKIQLLEDVKTFVKSNNIASKLIHPLFSVVRSAVAAANYILIEKGYKLFKYILTRLSLQGYAHHSATQGRRCYPILYARLLDPNKLVRDGAANALVHYWTAIPALCFAIEFRFFVREYLVGQPLQAAHLLVDTIVSKLHNEEGHLIVEEEFIGRNSKSIGSRKKGVERAAKVIDNTSVDVRQPKIIHTTNASEGEDFVTTLAHREAYNAAIEIGKEKNQLPLVENPSTSPLSLPTAHHDLHTTHQLLDTEPARHSDAASKPVQITKAHSVHDIKSHPVHDAGQFQDHNLQANIQDDVKSATASIISDVATNSTHVAGHHPFTGAPPLPTYTPRLVKDDHNIKPINISSTKQLATYTKDMKTSFEVDDKNTESTWKQRLQPNIDLLRAITKGNAPSEFRPQYLDTVKVLLPGIMKCVNSPRTVVSSLACTLLQEMVATIGSNMDPHADFILSETIKLCGSTRKIVSENGGVTVDVIFAYISYNSRYFKHISNACEDKNIQTRLSATKWLKTIILHHRLKIEHARNLEPLIKYITKGLTDANPTVREEMRSTFWTFARVWPQHGATIFQSSDLKSQAMVMRDPESFNLLDNTPSSPAGRPALQKGTTEPSRALAFRENVRTGKRPVTAGHADARLKLKSRPSEDEVAGPSTSRPASALSLNKPGSMASRSHRQPLSRPISAMSAPKGKALEVARGDAPVGTLRSAPLRFANRPFTATKVAKASPKASTGPRRMFGNKSVDESSASLKPKLTADIQAADIDSERPPSSSTSSSKRTLVVDHTVHDTTNAVDGAISRPVSQDSHKDELLDDMTVQTPFNEPQDIQDPPIETEEAEINEGLTEIVIPPTLSEPEEFSRAPEEHQETLDHPTELQETETNDCLTEVIALPTLDEAESSRAPQERQEALRRRSSGIPRLIKVYQDPQTDDQPRTSGSARALEPKPLQQFYHSRFAATPWDRLDIPPDYEEQRPPSPLNGVGKLTEKDSRVFAESKRLWERKNGNHEQNIVTPLNREEDHLNNYVNRAIDQINARTLDAHGYQRLYGIVREIGGNDYSLSLDTHVLNILIAAAVECLASLARNSNIETPAAHAEWTRDTQYLLNLITEMDKVVPEFVEPVTILSVLIQLRGSIEQRDAIVYGIEELVLRLLPRLADPTAALEFALQAVKGELAAPEPHHGTVMGLFIIAGLLDRSEANLEVNMGDELTDFAYEALKNRSPRKEDGETTIGRATICFVAALVKHFGDRVAFIRAVSKGSMAHQAVLEWYLA